MGRDQWLKHMDKFYDRCTNGVNGLGPLDVEFEARSVMSIRPRVPHETPNFVYFKTSSTGKGSSTDPMNALTRKRESLVASTQGLASGVLGFMLGNITSGGYDPDARAGRVARDAYRPRLRHGHGRRHELAYTT